MRIVPRKPSSRRVAEAVLLGLIFGTALAIFLVSYYAAAILDARTVGLLGSLSAGAILALTITAGRAQ